MIGKIRDLTHIERPADKDILFAFDVIGGIGPLPADSVTADPEDVGYFGARVVLMELLSLGATPIVLADLLTLPWQGAGERVVAGIRALLAEGGFPGLPLTGSTEENVRALATGAGFVGVGEAAASEIRHGRARAGDLLYLLGRPKSAPEDRIQRHDPEILAVRQFRDVMRDELVREALPLGSGGLAHELRELLGRGLGPEFKTPLPPELLRRSGGPATSVLLVTAPQWRGVAAEAPLMPLGRLSATR